MATSGAADINALVSLFRPAGGGTSTTTNGGSATTSNGGTATDTTTVGTSDETINAIVKSMLEGDKGLASIAGGQKSAGLYNSSTNSLLQNDLLARVAAEAAKSRQTTTRTVADNTTKTTVDNTTKTTNTTPTPQLNAGKTAATLGALKIGSPLLKELAGSLGLKTSAGSSIKNGAKSLWDKFNAPSVDDSVMDKYDAGSTYSGNIGGTSADSSVEYNYEPSASVGADAGVGAASSDAGGGADFFSADTSGADLSAADFTGDSSTDFSDFGTDSASSGLDIGSFGSDAAAEYGAGSVSDLTPDFTSEASSSVADSFDTSDLGDFFFANGGRVPKRSAPKRAFANGGRVNPDSIYDGEPQKQIVKINSAQDGTGSSSGAAGNTKLNNAVTSVSPQALRDQAIANYRRQQEQLTGNKDTISKDTDGNTAESTGPNAGYGSYGDPAAAIGAFGQAIGTIGLGAVSFGAVPGAVAVANIASQAETGHSVTSNIVSQAIDAIFGNSAGDGTSALGAAIGADTAMGNQAEAEAAESASAVASADAAAAAEAADNASYGDVGVGSFGSATGEAAPGESAPGDDGGSANNGSDGQGESGGSSGESSGEGSSGDGGGDGGSFANGGNISGHDLQGKDNIPIQVSGGEYVIPTDVVDHLGEDFFDNLVGKFHKPIRGGK